MALVNANLSWWCNPGSDLALAFAPRDRGGGPSGDLLAGCRRVPAICIISNARLVYLGDGQYVCGNAGRRGSEGGVMCSGRGEEAVTRAAIMREARLAASRGPLSLGQVHSSPALASRSGPSLERSVHVRLSPPLHTCPLLQLTNPPDVQHSQSRRRHA